MPAIDPSLFTELVAEVHTNVFVKRSVDHRALETLAVGELAFISSVCRRADDTAISLVLASTALKHGLICVQSSRLCSESVVICTTP